MNTRTLSPSSEKVNNYYTIKLPFWDFLLKQYIQYTLTIYDWYILSNYYKPGLKQKPIIFHFYSRKHFKKQKRKERIQRKSSALSSEKIPGGNDNILYNNYN